MPDMPMMGGMLWMWIVGIGLIVLIIVAIVRISGKS